MQKPVRRTRRFIRRTGKGKGQGKGKSRYSFLAEMNDDEVEETFFGEGKGYGKGKRSPGKGKGRRKNPIGSDGQVMRCGICNADDHFRAQCPRNSHRDTSAGDTSFGGYAESGPLGDLLYPVFETEPPVFNAEPPEFESEPPDTPPRSATPTVPEEVPPPPIPFHQNTEEQTPQESRAVYAPGPPANGYWYDY